MECTITGDLAAKDDSNNDDEARITLTVEPEETGEITNEATVELTGDTTTGNNEVTIETDVQADNNNGGNNNNRRQYRPPRLFPPGFLEEIQEQYEEAENELSSLENGEGTSDTFSDGLNEDEGTTGDDGGAVAQSGDPDEFAPETSTRGEVVDEVPTEGPLPNTGGASLWAYALPGLGLLLLGTTLMLRRSRR